MATDDPKPSEALVFVEYDGTAYELTDEDKIYVDTEFAGADSGRPFIKDDYDERNGWGLLNGYLLRSKLPKGVPVRPASERPPPELRQQAQEAALREILKKRGLQRQP
jgi:hypothetical protein